MRTALRDGKPRAQRSVHERGGRLTHAPARARDVLPARNDGRFQKAVFRRPQPHRGVKGEGLPREKDVPRNTFARERDVVRPRRFGRVEIGGECGELFRARLQIRLRDGGKPRTGDERNLLRPRSERGERRRERSGVVAVNARLLRRVPEPETVEGERGVLGRAFRFFAEQRNVALRLRPFPPHFRLERFPFFCAPHEHGHVIRVIDRGHGIPERRADGKGNPLGGKFFPHGGDGFLVRHSADRNARNGHVRPDATRPSEEKKRAPDKKER